MKRIQVQLTDKRLDDVVTEMASAATAAVAGVVKLGAAQKQVEQAVRQSLRKVLGQYVHAYNVCGLAVVCQEANEIDPWAMKDQDKD